MAPSQTNEASVLLVDNDAETRTIVRQALVDAGVTVVAVTTGREALDVLLSRESVALVILELRVPVINGEELIAIMASYTRLSRIPIAVLSSNSGNDVRGPRVIAHFRKPLRIDDLLAVVRARVSDSWG